MTPPAEQGFSHTAYLSGLVGAEVVEVEALTGGRNSNTWRITDREGTQYVAKQYTGKTADGRSRTEAEFSSLTFLSQLNIECVPTPVVIDLEMEWAIYEHLDGEPIPPAEVTPADILQAANFLLRLNGLKNNEAAATLPPAAEACFSLEDLILNLDNRLRILLAVELTSNHAHSLRRFLETNFRPAWQIIEEWVRSKYEEMGLEPDIHLELNKRILSPSDFGFHNALRQADGQLVFLDFEYFGWDDPAKMISDFLLHPGMTLSDPLKQEFLATLMPGLDGGEELTRRVTALYPMYGLKWCLILLNEFLPERVLRRQQSQGPKQDPRSQQLSKAQDTLDRMVANYRKFPYWVTNNWDKKHVAIQH